MITLIAIDPAKNDALIEAAERLEKCLDRATVKPRDKWESVSDHAARIGLQAQTFRKWIRQGSIDSRRVANRLYVWSNPDV